MEDVGVDHQPDFGWYGDERWHACELLRWTETDARYENRQRSTF